PCVDERRSTPAMAAILRVSRSEADGTAFNPSRVRNPRSGVRHGLWKPGRFGRSFPHTRPVRRAARAVTLVGSAVRAHVQMTTHAARSIVDGACAGSTHLAAWQPVGPRRKAVAHPGMPVAHP